jgi:hypothetical protein
LILTLPTPSPCGGKTLWRKMQLLTICPWTLIEKDDPFGKTPLSFRAAVAFG